MADSGRIVIRRVTKRGVFINGRRYLVKGLKDIITDQLAMSACMDRYEGCLVHVFIPSGTQPGSLHGRIGKEYIHLYAH